MMPRRPGRGDLKSDRLPQFDFSAETSESIVQKIFRLVEGRALVTIDWYLAEKERKAFWARILRTVAVISATLGAITPLAAQITGLVSLVWGYILLGLAALAVAVDKVLGLSSTWSRYMVTAVAIQQDLYQLQLEWVKLSTMHGTAVKLDVEAAWALLIQFSDTVTRKVQSETLEWSAEFSSQLSALENQTRGAGY